jgi:hypothetical protein
MPQNLVYPKLPNAGLCNMLLVWANAIVFANINSFPVVAPSWNRIRIGPLLRGEREKRYYGGYFSKKTYSANIIDILFNLRANKVYDPPINRVDLSDQRNSCIYIFSTVPHWKDYFVDIRSHHSLIKEVLISTIRPSVLEEISARPVPQIGIHVRRGDFRSLQPGEDFSKVGLVRTPMSWYCRVLSKIREIAGYNVSATIFSDGYDHELKDLLELPQVDRATRASAISDLFTLSASKLLITSAGSTFSGWASYLGRSPTVWHPAHFHAGVFSDEVNKTIFEGSFDPEIMEVPELLRTNIESVF